MNPDKVKMAPNEKHPAKMSDYQSFLKAKHERLFNTPAGVIDEVVRKAIGAAPAERERIIKGEVNEVYGVKIDGGREIIVRISRGSEAESQFQKEGWAIEQAAKAGVPVPHVLLVEPLQVEDQTLGVSVEERLPGLPLDELADRLSGSELAKILQRAGALLSQIHSIRTEGFGELDKKGRGERASIAFMFSEESLDPQELLVAARTASLNPDVIERAVRILEKYQEHYPPVAPHLLHGDFAPKHILIDDGKITGIIDFENAHGGDPVQEFANWQFFFEGRYPIEPIKEGYAGKSLFDDEFEHRFFIWKLLIGLIDLCYYVEEGNQSGINHCKKRIPSDLSYFDRTRGQQS